jgi:hypothetical protein
MTKMNLLTMMFHIMEFISLIETCALPNESVEWMVNYGTDAFGADCGHTMSAVVRIHLRAIIAICAQREKSQQVVICGCIIH